MVCETDFDFINRRHHCRRCGRVVCNSCSLLRIKEKRVCTSCGNEFTRLSLSFQRNSIRAPFLEHQKAWFLSLGDILSLPNSAELLQQLQSNYDGFISDLFSKGVLLVDFILNSLSLNEKQLPQEWRAALLQLLIDVLYRPEGYLQFNSVNQVRTRVHRIKILLYHLNEELSPCPDILRLIRYKSIIFEKILAGQRIRYTLVLDRSTSMNSHDNEGKSRWRIAKDAIEHMAEQIEKLTSGTVHGMTLWMFSDPPHNKYPGLRTCDHVEAAFIREKVSGSTDLAGVLNNVFEDHFSHNEPEHVLVVTDGEPNSKEEVHRVLVKNINSLTDPDNFGITFMQVGCCVDAAEYLHDLQDHLIEQGARHNIVDSLTHEDYDGLSLCGIIHRYLPSRPHY
jgi:hypothetical protein